MSAELLDLPWQIQVSLASGYAGYVLANLGVRFRQRAVDVAFITLAFGLFATGVLFAFGDQRPLVGGIAAFVSTCAAGAAWRKWGRAGLRGLLRALEISWMDDDPTALFTMSDTTRFDVSQIAVQLDDGRWLQCKDIEQFAGAPFAPFLLGPDGDIALYLTHEESVSGEEKTLTTVRDPYYGDRITYIPAARVRRISVRHKNAR